MSLRIALLVAIVITSCRSRAAPVSEPAPAFDFDLCTNGELDVRAVLQKHFDSVEGYDYELEVATFGSPCAKAKDAKACIEKYAALKTRVPRDRTNIYFLTRADDVTIFDHDFVLPPPDRTNADLYAAWALVTHGGPGALDCRAKNASLDDGGVRLRLASPCMLRKAACPESAYEEVVRVRPPNLIGIVSTTAKGGGGHPSR